MKPLSVVNASVILEAAKNLSDRDAIDLMAQDLKLATKLIVELQKAADDHRLVKEAYAADKAYKVFPIQGEINKRLKYVRESIAELQSP